MFPRRKRALSGLRVCPLCRASAINDVCVRELTDGGARIQVRCGECQTWRAIFVSERRATVLERRLLRRLDGDRREIQAAVWRAELGVEDSDLAKPVRRTRAGRV